MVASSLMLISDKNEYLILKLTDVSLDSDELNVSLFSDKLNFKLTLNLASD